MSVDGVSCSRMKSTENDEDNNQSDAAHTRTTTSRARHPQFPPDNSPEARKPGWVDAIAIPNDGKLEKSGFAEDFANT